MESFVRTSMLVSVLATACDGDDEPRSFGERDFLSESVEGRTLTPGTRISMGFSDDHYLVTAGCNTMSTEPYALVEGHLESAQFSTTEKGCDAELHEQDEWLRGFLEGAPAYSLVEPRLTLSDDDVTIVLIDREVADPDRPLTGREWRVTGLINDGFVLVAEWGPALLSFSDDGSFSIITPCAPGAGAFEVAGSTIVMSEVNILPEACADEEFAMTAHEHMSRVLADGEVEHHIDADHLTIERGDIGLKLSTE